VIGTNVKENEAFIYMAGHFASKGIYVPNVLAQSEDGMAYLLSDLGNEALFDKFTKANKVGENLQEVEELLCKTMAALPRIQFEGALEFDFELAYFSHLCDGFLGYLPHVYSFVEAGEVVE
jgi:aminoglycoside/choline kinase family phosphotransferase